MRSFCSSRPTSLASEKRSASTYTPAKSPRPISASALSDECEPHQFDVGAQPFLQIDERIVGAAEIENLGSLGAASSVDAELFDAEGSDTTQFQGAHFVAAANLGERAGGGRLAVRFRSTRSIGVVAQRNKLAYARSHDSTRTSANPYRLRTVSAIAGKIAVQRTRRSAATRRPCREPGSADIASNSRTIPAPPLLRVASTLDLQRRPAVWRFETSSRRYAPMARTRSSSPRRTSATWRSSPTSTTAKPRSSTRCSTSRASTATRSSTSSPAASTA